MNPSSSAPPRPPQAAPRPLAGRANLADRLHDPRCYPHAAGDLHMHETHISWVLLAGEFAYKVKKPVRLAFLDFSSLESRRRACEEEVRLNRRTAPGLYLGVVPIGGTPEAPRVGEPRGVFEYAVKMRRFPDGVLYSELVAQARLDDADVDSLAAEVAALHREASRKGQAQRMPEGAFTNLAEIGALHPGAVARGHLDALERWTRQEAGRLAGLFERRAAQGFVRECHGDLHLGNVARLDGGAALFDCIEFSEPLRFVDVMSDVAFASMDLLHHGAPRHAARFLDRYLELTGDYPGLALLRFYQVYRALVRAKVALLGGSPARADALLGLAGRLTRRAPAVLVLMHGVSGSGKTTASARLLEALGAVRVRSDVERKRLHGIEPAARAAADVGAGIYGARENAGTYERLGELAREILAAGYPAIVDAAFLRRADRDRFRALAARERAAFEIVACGAPEEVLRRRVAERERGARDASDAGVAVLEAQLRTLEPLGEEERFHALAVRTDRGDWASAIDAFARAHPAGAR